MELQLEKTSRSYRLIVLIYSLISIIITFLLHKNSIYRSYVIFSIPILFTVRWYSIQHRNFLTLSIFYILGSYCGIELQEFLRNNLLEETKIQKNYIVILDRLALIIYILPFMLLWFITKHRPKYLTLGSFKNKIQSPFIWYGFTESISRAIISVILVNLIIYSFFFDINILEKYIYLGVLFSLINAVLEEVFWRGLLLSYFSNIFGEKYAILIVSCAFGMYHLSLNINTLLCFIFIIFGILLGGITVKAQGILPAILLHFIMNIFMVLYGVIFH